MANKGRPKGSYKTFLLLGSRDLGVLDESMLRGIVSKLNDAANKRVKRLIESGYAPLSPAIRSRMDHNTFIKFSIPESASLEDLKAAYFSARNFLQDSTTGSIKGMAKYNERFSDVYANVLGFEFGGEETFDRRYKKKKVIKKSVQKKLSDFWRKYDEWREIAESENPNEAGDTNINSVEKFYEEVYSKGKTDYDDMEELARSQYIEAEQSMNEEDYLEDEAQQPNVSAETPIGQRKKSAKQNKPSRTGKKKEWSPKLRFEKIKIF